MPTRGKKNLSPLEARFVRHYALGKPGIAGNGKKAALSAGYAAGSAAVTASRLLTRANVLAAVEEARKSLDLAAIADAQEIDTRMTSILRDTDEPAFIRVQAAKELNKVMGRHSIKHLHTGKLTLEQALAMTKHPDDV